MPTETPTDPAPTPNAPCAATGNETVSTNKADYAPEETAHITGHGYAPSCDVVVKITRPDGSIFTGAGTSQPGSDTVAIDDDGRLFYDYILNGIVGTYLVEVLGADDVVLATTTFTDNHGVDCTVPLDNPSSSSCTLTFTALQGADPSPATQSFRFGLTDSGTCPGGTITESTSWFSLSATSFSTFSGSGSGVNVTVTVDSDALAAGPYTGTITINPGDSGNSNCSSNKTVTVNLTVTAPCPGSGSSTGLPFTSSFGCSNTNTVNVDNWVDSDGSGSNCVVDDGSARPGSPTDQQARLQSSCNITRTLDATGFTGIQLSYYWRGDSDAESSDELQVFWKLNSDVSYTELGTGHPLNNTSWSSQVTWSLPAAANGQTIQIRFVGASSSSGEQARLDDVAVTGTAAPSDTTDPTAGTVNDGSAADIDYQASTSQLQANWTGFADNVGIDHYLYGASTSSSCATRTVIADVNVGTNTSRTTSSLTLANGTTYYNCVNAFDAAGNDTGWVASDGVTVDSGAPLTGSVNDGSAADIDYQASTSQLQSNWTGFSDAGSGINHYDYGASTSNTCTGNVVGTTNVGNVTSNTAGSLTLANGTTYYNCVRAVDNVGNTSGWVASDGVTVDSTAPTGGTVNDGSAADIDSQTSTSQLQANWSGFSDNVAIHHYLYGASTSSSCATRDVIADVNVGTNTSQTTGSLSLTSGTTYYNCVNGYDAAGNNTGWVASDGVTVDSTAPTAGSVNDGSAADIDYQSSTSQLQANWTGFTDNVGIDHYLYGASTSSSCASRDVIADVNVGTNTSRTTSSLTLANGTTYYNCVNAYDAANNSTGWIASDGVTVDTSAPTTGSINDGSAADIDYQSSTSQLESNWTGFSDPGSGIDHYDYGASTSNTCTGDVVAATGVGTNTSHTASSLSLTNGTTYYNCVRAADGVGNTSAWVASDGVTVDTSSPTSTITFPVNGTSYNETGFKAGCSTATTSDVCGTSTDTGSGVNKVELSLQRSSDSKWWDGSTWLTSVTEVFVEADNTTWSYALPFSNLGNDSYTLHVRGTDNVGNVESSPVVSFTIDTLAPTVTIVSAVPNPVIVPTDANTVVTWNADESGTYSVRVGGTSCSTGTQVASGSYTAPADTTTTIAASSLAYGANTVRVCVTDAATNVGSATTTVNKKAQTSLLYNGQDVVAGGTNLILGAKLSSANAGCSVSGQTIHFTVEDVTSGVDYPVDGTTDASGQATVIVSGAITAGWDLGPHFVDADFDATATCVAAETESVITLTAPGQAATGGGWYTLTGNGRLNFGFNVNLVPGTGIGASNPPQFKGKLLLNNNGKWRLKGDLTSYAKINSTTTCPGSNCKGSANGTGKLYVWDQTLNGGLGDWSLVSISAPFAITFLDAGQGGGKKSLDAFGIIISYSVSALQPPLPNSPLTVLKGGDISIK